MKRFFRVVLGLMLGLALIGPVASSAQAAPYCGIYWGSLAKSVPTMSGHASMLNLRTGEHPCFDRMVIDVRGDVRGYSARYVNQVYADGSGFLVPLRGGARLEVVATVPTYDGAGHVTYRPRNSRELSNVSGYRTFRQIASAGSFEGQTTIGLGVRARLPFRVFILDGPGDHSRLVIDVAHLW
ncbi:AMIN-like domain-containing (lipo)protein [Georgenia wangjunii]|uniref:AMIN-like domain-containing (lipo)protein n=1 Tax=Georgenia wangjunii TaxID=3117730 RepID=UPI002F26BADF